MNKRTLGLLNNRFYAVLAIVYFISAGIILSFYFYTERQTVDTLARKELVNQLESHYLLLHRLIEQQASDISAALYSSASGVYDFDRELALNTKDFATFEAELSRLSVALKDPVINQENAIILSEQLPNLKRDMTDIMLLLKAAEIQQQQDQPGGPKLKPDAARLKTDRAQALAVLQVKIQDKKATFVKRQANLFRLLQDKKQRLTQEFSSHAREQQQFVFIAVLLLFGVFLIAGNYLIAILFRPVYALDEYIQEMLDGTAYDKTLGQASREYEPLVRKVNQLNARQLLHHQLLDNLLNNKPIDRKIQLDDKDENAQQIIQLQQKIFELREDESRKNWLLNGLTIFSDIIRNSTDLKTLSEDLLLNLSKYVRANLSAIFLVKEDVEGELILEMTSSYAYNKKNFTRREFKLGEGPVGQVAYSLETIYFTTIPENYITLSSGLGEAPPSSLLLVPLISSNTLYGVLELASFNRFRQDEIEFVKKIAENAAAVIGSLRNNEKTLNLLKQAQNIRAELEKQSVVLQANAESLAKAKQTLELTNKQLEDQVRRANLTATELTQSERRTYSLLENASEIITVFESDGSVRYQSPSIIHILGYSPTEAMPFTRIINSVDIPIFQDFFKNVLLYPDQTHKVQYLALKKDGHSVVLETKGRNFVQDDSIKGIVTNTREITDEILAEQMNRRRAMFESLSENSPDLIIRMAPDGRYIYVNPVIEKFTGNQPKFYLDQTIYTVQLAEDEIRFWESLLTEIKENKAKIKREHVFPSLYGDRVVQVEAIPEFDTAQESTTEYPLQSVLAIVHDITDLKAAESKILAQNQKLEQINVDLFQEKKLVEEFNKDITESIQYAKRIQESILPNILDIQRHLPNLFVYYQPRDIVSGDFYWFSQRGNRLFFAVVDCTGHGVPGAFMSLIGYNLLNQIVNEQEVYDPGLILDHLHHNLVNSLKQNNPHNTKDGMDAVICLIEPERRLVQLASANRPVYWWHQYELHQVKGDPQGIGNDSVTPFQTHVLEIEPGDTLYLFTDGYVDQFGGPLNKKFAPRRFRELLTKNQHKSMSEQRKMIERNFAEWKGEYPQIDDVLVVGIRF
jgi:PAS domain S-box-containing protein